MLGSEPCLRGELFVYSPEKRLVAFQSPAQQQQSGASGGASPDVVVLIGGLTDGFFATPYVPALADALAAAGWSLVQVLLTSSYAGWGTASLASDAAELAELLAHLRERRGARRIVVMGHSTGCQDIVELLRDGSAAAAVSAAVLQAPVSDREYLATLPDTSARLVTAQALVSAGRGGELLPLAHDGDTPVTAARFASLAALGGADDLFSSDLTAAALSAALGHVSVPVLLVPSLADEYVPAHVDARALMTRMAAAMGRSPHVEICELEGAPHALATPAEVATLVDAVLGLLARL